MRQRRHRPIRLGGGKLRGGRIVWLWRRGIACGLRGATLRTLVRLCARGCSCCIGRLGGLRRRRRPVAGAGGIGWRSQTIRHIRAWPCIGGRAGRTSPGRNRGRAVADLRRLRPGHIAARLEGLRCRPASYRHPSGEDGDTQNTYQRNSPHAKRVSLVPRRIHSVHAPVHQPCVLHQFFQLRPKPPLDRRTSRR
jgi:hypothetical protein